MPEEAEAPMVYATTHGDLVLGYAPDGAVVPPALQGLETEVLFRRAFFVDGAIVDGADLDTFFIEPNGIRHAVAGEGRQELECSWDEPLVREDGVWRVRAVGDDLADARAAKAAAVNAARDVLISAGYQHNFGGSAGIRTLDQRSEGDAINWLGLYNLAAAAVAGGQGSTLMAVRDAGNQTFQASAATIASAMTAMALWRAGILAHSWDLKGEVAAAADAEDLDAIDIETGWPV